MASAIVSAVTPVVTGNFVAVTIVVPRPRVFYAQHQEKTLRNG